MKKFTFVLIVFIFMISFSSAQTKYSDTIKNVLGVSLFPLLPILPVVFDFKSEELSNNFALDFRYKHNFTKGAIRIGAFMAIKGDDRYNNENIIYYADTMYTYHKITGSANYFGLRLGYERSRKIKTKWRFNYGADLVGYINRLELYDDPYSMTKMKDTLNIWVKSQAIGSNLLNTTSFVVVGFSPFISWDYFISRKFSLTAQINYDYYSEHSLDAATTGSSFIGKPSFNLMLNYLFSVKRK